MTSVATADVHELHARRRPPAALANLEAEQGVLGGALLYNDLIEPLSAILRPEHFSEEIHRRIFHVAVDLRRMNKPASPITIPTYIGDSDLGNGVTIPQYLARLVGGAVPPAVVADMAREIRDLAARRDLLVVGQRLIEDVHDAPVGHTASDIAAKSLGELQTVAELSIAADTRRDAAACAAALLDRAGAIARGERRDTGVSTGIQLLDRATGGFRRGTLWVVAGRPRMGKTILATGFARKVAARGARAADDGLPAVGAQIFSLEVDEDEVTARILADLAYTTRRPICFGSILRGELEEQDLDALAAAQRRLDALPIALDVASGLTVVDIAARVRAEKTRMAKRGIRLALVCVDYLKFVRPTDHYRGNRVYEVGEVTRGLKQLAKDEGVCVMLLAQVSRAVEGRDRKSKLPGLADLRESGDLEADADVVVFIDRESVRIKQSDEYRNGDAEATNRFLDLQNKADLIVAKTRTGSETTVSIWIDTAASTFAAQAMEGA